MGPRKCVSETSLSWHGCSETDEDDDNYDY